eukprot:scaffold4229_cov30-Tisochrysis_lutea.AAC.7
MVAILAGVRVEADGESDSTEPTGISAVAFSASTSALAWRFTAASIGASRAAAETTGAAAARLGLTPTAQHAAACSPLIAALTRTAPSSAAPSAKTCRACRAARRVG